MSCMFDEHSFLDEITNPSEAEACYKYLAHNMGTFKEEMANEGKDFEDQQKCIRQVWTNLVKSSQRVGYTNDHINEVAKKFGL